MPTSPTDTPSVPSSDQEPPSHETFLAKLETLFGSRDPDFDHFGELLHRRYEEEKEAGNDEIADTIWKVHRVPLDVACEAQRRWDNLSADTKQSVLDLLQSYEDKLDTVNETQKLK